MFSEQITKLSDIIKQAGKVVIHVRNKAQKALIDYELKGQLSDGMWENTRPDWHWEVWSDANVVADGQLGITGSLRTNQKRNYQFDDPGLVDVVGDRMLFIARLAKKGYKEDVIDKLHFAFADECRTVEDVKEALKGYASKYKKDILDNFGSLEKFVEEANDPSYTMANLHQDLKDIKYAFRTDLKPKKEELPKSTSDLRGKSFQFTGPLRSMKRREAEELVKSKGGTISGVNRGLTYLVTNDTESGSAKNEKAKMLGIEVIDEKQFLDLIGDYDETGQSKFNLMME